MKPMHWSAIALVALVMFGAHEAQANRISEVVGARANARAGGPISDHDAWLLERYGALSGTSNYWRRSLAPRKKYRRRYRTYRRGYRH